MGSENLVKNSDSLIDLLAAQCSDLERLLALAKDEMQAAGSAAARAMLASSVNSV